MAANAISVFKIGKDGLTGEMRRSGRAWKKLVAEFGGVRGTRAVASGMQPILYVGRYLGHHARIGSILIMTTEGVVKAAGFQRMNEEIRSNTLRDVPENGAEATEAVQAPRPQITHLPLTPRRRYITRADLRRYGVTIGCSA